MTDFIVDNAQGLEANDSDQLVEITSIIYLNFYGCNHASYINSELNIAFTDFSVSSSRYSWEDICEIIQSLNENQQGIHFVLLEKDCTSDIYSTIYIGETHIFDAFAPGIRGISETSGNATKKTCSFSYILEQNIQNTDELKETILHEAGHLTGILSHDYNANGLDITDYMFPNSSRIVVTEDTAINHATFSGNTDTASGGAIDHQNGILSIASSLFQDNTASNSYGGAIFSQNGNLQISESTFSNHCALRGGAIYLQTPTTVSDSFFTGNSASRGGAVYASSSSSFLLTGCTFSENTSSNGGALYLEGTGTISSCTFETERDSIYFQQTAEIIFTGVNNIAAKIQNAGTVTASSATLRFINDSTCSVTGNAFLSENFTLDFSGSAPVTFSNEDFSNVNHIFVNYDTPLYETTITVFSTKNKTLNLSNRSITVNGVTGNVGSIFSNYRVTCNDKSLLLTLFPTPIVSQSGTVTHVTINSRDYDSALGYTSISQAFSVSPCVVVTNYICSTQINISGTQTIVGSDSEFTGGSSDNGGVIYNEGTLEFQHILLSDNNASTTGGAIFSKKDMSIESSTFSNNSASEYGGAVSSLVGTVSINDSSFYQNYASHGGAILTESSFNITGSLFRENNANSGGVIFSKKDTSIASSTFSNNSASEYGGAVSSLIGTVSINDSSFYQNYASRGGAILTESSFNIADSLFQENNANSGGAIRCISNGTETAVMEGCTFSNNSASLVGGAIYSDMMTIITDGVFLGNTATTGGAIAYNYITSLLLDGCTFCENDAEIGGALYIYDGADATVSNCTFQTEKDSIALSSNATLTFLGTNNLAADIVAGTETNDSIQRIGAINAENARLCFTNTSSATVSGLWSFSTNSVLEFLGSVPVVFSSGDIFETLPALSVNCELQSISTSKTVFTVSSGNLDNLNGHAITINGETGEIGSEFSRYRVSCASNKLEIEFLSTPIVSPSGDVTHIRVNSIDYDSLSGYTSVTEAFANRDVIAVTGCSITEVTTISVGQTLALIDSEFSCDHVSTNGGAINNSGELNLMKTIFHDSTASTKGGAIYGSSTAKDCYANACTFSHNSATRGGSIYTETPFDFNACTFFDNTVKKYGGAISFEQNAITGSESSISGCEFERNTSSQYAGAIYLSNATSYLENTKFYANVAGKTGGAIYCYSGFLSVTGGKFYNNRSDTVGGAICIAGTGTAIFDNTDFTGNTASTGGAIYIKGSNSVTIKDSTFATSSDSIWNADGKSVITLQGKVALGADFYSASAVDCSNAELILVQKETITIDAELTNLNKLIFSGNGTVVFSQIQDFSNTVISINCNDIWDKDSVTIAEGNFVFAENQLITINGYEVTLGEKGELGYTVTYDGMKLQVSQETHDLPRSGSGIDGTQLCEWISSTDSMLINFGTDSSTTTKTTTGTASLVVGSNKYLLGGGSSVTSVALNLYGDGNDITIENLTWKQYLFGGGISDYTKSGVITVKGDTSILYACAGSYLKTANEILEESNMTLNIEGATGSSILICAGNFVKASTTQIGDTNLCIDANCTLTNTAGYVTGGSVISAGVEYTVYGDSMVQIASGKFERVMSGGLIQNSTASYTHCGNLNFIMSGGTVGTIIFGGIGSNLAASGTKTVEGDINMTFDSSSNTILLYSVFGGCNGYGHITGDINITFTGLGENLQFNGEKSCVIGENASAMQGGVDGNKNLTFDNFQGDFTARLVKKFDELAFINNTHATFTQVYDLSCINTWRFDIDSDLIWDELHNNSFRNDVLIFGSEGDELQEDSITFFSVAEDYGFDDFDSFSQVLLFGTAATYQEEQRCWTTSEYVLNLKTDDQTNYNYLTVSVLSK